VVGEDAVGAGATGAEGFSGEGLESSVDGLGADPTTGDSFTWGGGGRGPEDAPVAGEIG